MVRRGMLITLGLFLPLASFGSSDVEEWLNSNPDVLDDEELYGPSEQEGSNTEVVDGITVSCSVANGVSFDDKDRVLLDFSIAACSVGATLSDDERYRWIRWGMSVAERYPNTICNLSTFWSVIGATLADSAKCKIAWWSVNQTTNHVENLVYLGNLLEANGATLSNEDKREMSMAIIQCLDRDDGERLCVIDVARAVEAIGPSLSDVERENLVLKICKRLEAQPRQFADLASTLRIIGPMLSEDKRREMLAWVEGQIDKHLENFQCYAELVDVIGVTLSDCDKCKRMEWCAKKVEEIVSAPLACQGHERLTSLTTTNVIVHYVFNSVQPEIVTPITESTGYVNVITEIKGGAVAIPDTWIDNYPSFTEKYGSDFSSALVKKTGKKDGAGNDMLVWQDYVAGTDPTDENSKFTASVTMVGGKPVVSYSPELSAAEAAKRVYTTYGKAKLQDAVWTVVPEGGEADYNFFKVSVEMK